MSGNCAWQAARMLDEVMGRRLRAVERFAWRSDDGSPSTPEVGSVHMWFEGGRGVHVDGGSDWTLRCSVTEPGDDGWIGTYLYDNGGRWVIRAATDEQPFADLAGSRLTSVAARLNEVGEVVGLDLNFEGRNVSLSLHEGEITTSSR